MRNLIILLSSLCSITVVHAQLPSTVSIHLYDTVINQPYVYNVQPAINGVYQLPEAAQRFYSEIPAYTLIYPHRQISYDFVLYITAYQDSLSKTYQPGTLTADLKRLSDTLSAREERRLEEELLKNPPKMQENDVFNGIVDGVYAHVFVHPDSVLPKHYVKYNLYPSPDDPITTDPFAGYRSAMQPWMDRQLQPFYICNHEVTNAEYRKFVDWVRDSIALTLLYREFEDDLALTLLNCSKKELKQLDPEERDENLRRFGLNHALCYGKNSIYQQEDYVILLQNAGFYYPQSERFYQRREVNINNLKYASMSISPTSVYPDTLCWLKDFPVSFMDPFTNMYFWHPAYNNHPVVGLSLSQINAYCDWLQRRMPEGLTVTLPSRYHYELAVKACMAPEQRSLVTVEQALLAMYPRSPEKMIHLILRGGILPENFKNPPSNSFVFNWYETYQTHPINDLAGSVSEVICNQVPDSLSSTHMYTTGGNRAKYVVSTNEEAYNTTFYQQTVPVSGNSMTGFRIVLIPARHFGTTKTQP